MGMVELFGKPPDACRLGIACTLTWAFWLNGASGAPTDQPLWQLSYVVLSAMMAVLGVCALKRPHAMDAGRLGSAGAGMGVLGTIALVASLNMPNAGSLQVPAYLACGCALGLLYLQWGPFYAQVSTKQMVGYLLAANIAASLLKCVVHFVPDPLSFVLAAALPVVSAIACFRTQKTMPEAPAPTARFSDSSAFGLWKVFVALAVFSFLAAFLLGHAVGNQSAVPPANFAASRAFEMVVSAVVMVYVTTLGRSFNFAQLWRIVLVALAADVLLQIVLPEFGTLRCIESAVWDLIVLFSWLTIADIAWHAVVDSLVVFGLGWLFYTLPFAAGSLVATAVGPGGLSSALVAVVLFVLLLTSAFCLEVRDQDAKLVFSELDESPDAPRDASEVADIEGSCEALARAHGLSPRELEVMKYLAKGRTKAYIAETLYLSENTVRSHTKHIYTKLDVHSKRDLMDLVGVE